MNALLRKEARLASDVMLGGCVLLAASFPLALAGVAMQGVTPFPWLAAFGGACVLNQYTMVLTGALLGAVAFAREREDGNVHFLASLPLAPRRHYAAKVAATLMLWVLLWALNAAILAGFIRATGHGLGPLLPFVPRMLGVLALSFAALGFASFAGNHFASVTGAAFAGAAGLLLAAVLRSFWMSANQGGAFFDTPFLTLLGVLGAAGLGGAAHSFRPAGKTLSRGAAGELRTPAGVFLTARPGFRSGAAALLWKDARLLRAPVALGLLLCFLPFAAAGGNALIAGSAAEGFRTASLLAIALGWIALPLWSGSSLAGEWAANTQPFLSCLPVSARRVLAAKFAVAAVPGALVFAVCAAVFLLAETRIAGEPALRANMTWDEYNTSHFLGGAFAYACALPVTFAVAWYFAARLRRKIVSIVLGVVSGPLAMAAWAVTSAPEGYIVGHLPPVASAGLHAAVLAALSVSLVVLGARHVAKSGLA